MEPVSLDQGRRRSMVTAIAFFLTMLSVFGLTAPRDVIHIDAHAAAVEAWHIAATGSPWLEGDLSREMMHNEFIARAANGHVVGRRMAGPVVAAIPFYWAMNSDPDPNQFRYLPSALAAATLTALAVLLLMLALRRYIGSSRAIVGAVAVGLATPTWTISANMLWTHPLTQLGIAGAAYGCSRKNYWMAGTFLAFGMLGRPHLAIVAALLGVGIAWRSRRLAPVFALGTPTLSALVVLLFWNRWMFGEWSIGGAYAGKAGAAVEGFSGSAEWDGPFAQLTNYVGFLVSADRGLFVWTPVVLLMIPAVLRYWRDLPEWAGPLLLGGVAYSIVQLRLNYFPGGDEFYGYRHALELMTCGAPVFVMATVRMGRFAKTLLPVLLAFQLAIITPGALAEGFWLDIDDVWTGNAYLVAWDQRPMLLSAWMGFCLLVAAVFLLIRRIFVAQPAEPEALTTSNREEHSRVR